MKFKFYLLFLFIPYFSYCQDKKTTENKIQWLSFSEAVEKNNTVKKKFLIDVYTEWCGWCKKMDASTYENQQLIKYVNENFYAVKFDAETKDTIRFANNTFVNPDPANKRSPHQMAVALLNGKMGYPSTVFLDENFNMLSPVQGYLNVGQLEKYLVFFGANHYKEKKFEEFETQFIPGFKE